MNTVAKILIVVNLVLAGAFLASAANFLGQLDHWKLKYQDAELAHKTVVDTKDAEITRIRDEMSNLVRDSQEALTARARAEATATEARNQADMMAEAHKQAAGALTQATGALEKAQDTIQNNRTLIDALQQERAALADSKRTALDAKEAAVRRLAEKEIQFENLLAQRQALEARVEDLQNQLRSSQMTTQSALAQLPDGADVAMDQPAHSGQVLSVDNRANVVILSLGSEDGVQPGFKYTVSRGSQYVGVIEITDVQAKQSAGRMVMSLRKSDVKRGDRVMSR